MAVGLALVVAVLLFASRNGELTAPSINPKNVYHDSRDCAAFIKVGDGSGSGILFKRIDPSGHDRWFAWTAAHVVDRLNTFEGGKVIARNDKLDVALLSYDATPSGSPRSSVFLNSTPELGESVFVVGSPYGVEYRNRIFFGQVSGVNEHLALEGWRWQTCDLFSGAVFPGNSGGPVFDSRGRVIGIIVGRSNVITIYVPIRYVAVWADKEKISWALVGDKCPAPVGEFDVPPIHLDEF